jgi:glycosyltransferase involved in cell wall biosynthesis
VDGEHFKKMGCTVPIHPFPAGIDTEILKPSDEPLNTNSWYHIGSLEWMPNREALEWFLSDIWPSLKSNHPDLEFYVAGKKMPDSVKNIRENGVFMLGEVDSATEFIADKGVCIVPLLSGSGIRIKILEAMSAGKVVISTSIGAQGIDYEDGKSILIANTADEFSAALSQLEQDENFARGVAVNARELILEKYSNQSVVNQLIAFYKDLLASNS